MGLFIVLVVGGAVVAALTGGKRKKGETNRSSGNADSRSAQQIWFDNARHEHERHNHK